MFDNLNIVSMRTHSEASKMCVVEDIASHIHEEYDMIFALNAF